MNFLPKGDWLRPEPWKYRDLAEWNMESTAGSSVSLSENVIKWS